MNEPEWPEKYTLDKNLTVQGYARREGFNEAIGLCQAAWLLSVDDPSNSPIGEVRQHPKGNYISIRADWVDSDGQIWPWVAVYPRGYLGGDGHSAVKGWPVVAVLPGTPAAEAQQ